MAEKIVYKVLCNEDEEVARIFFEIKKTGEQIEGWYQIQKWVNNLFNENEQLKEDLNYYKKRIKELEIENQGQSGAIDGLQGFIAHFDLEDTLND